MDVRLATVGLKMNGSEEDLRMVRKIRKTAKEIMLGQYLIRFRRPGNN